MSKSVTLSYSVWHKSLVRVLVCNTGFEPATSFALRMRSTIELIAMYAPAWSARQNVKEQCNFCSSSSIPVQVARACFALHQFAIGETLSDLGMYARA